MSVQPQLFPETPEAHASQPPSPVTPEGKIYAAKPAPLWLQRMSLFILVLFCVYVGAFVTWLPWWTAVWDENAWLQAHPQLWAFLKLGAVRGVISGLGLLDIWIGISEAVHYREAPRA